MTRQSSYLICAILIAGLCSGMAWADRGQVIGTVAGARSGIPVSVHPVVLMQGRDAIARTLTDRLGKFKLDFTYTPGEPLTIKTGSTTGYLEAQGVVEPDTEVAIKVMPRWATLLGIVTSRQTGRGMENIPVRVGRGEQLLPDKWASTTTDATGVFMLKVPAFDGDDVTKPVRDLWLSINESDDGSMAHAQVRSDTLPLWAWPDPTQPTKVEVSLPEANATGLTVADVVSIAAPEALAQRVPKPATAAPQAPASATPPASGAPPIATGEFIWTCPRTGQKYKITITPID